MKSEVVLETKFVCDIKGAFFVPAYQRGYRWSKTEVERLLDDIYLNGPNSYCLQPVVVRNTGERYELIDGQQRLTTIYLIYKFLNQMYPYYYDEPQFSLVYETRENSESFLKDIDLSKRNDNIDYWFISNAYECIEKWFAEEKRIRDRAISECFDKYTKIIWYEVGEDEDAVSLFTRLNIGKIPLTSAELVKAMLLREEKKDPMAKEKQDEIALQWDNIERELHNDSFWYFLTNETNMQYQTRIDLVLDLIANEPSDYQTQIDRVPDLIANEPTENKRKYYTTFFEIDKQRRKTNRDDLWRKIQQAFLTLKDWYENHELYHKIGYLIATGNEKYNLLTLFKEAEDKTKQEFSSILDSHIKESIAISENYGELSYEKPSDYKHLSTLLLLFNVESVRKAANHTQWFPFDKFKFDAEGKKVPWSLEHIHAQQSEGLQTRKAWEEWLGLHIKSLQTVPVPDEKKQMKEELLEEMEMAENSQDLDGTRFADLQRRAVDLLSEKGNLEYLHSISNLALLRFENNAVLNNSTFDVKRKRIIEMDRDGQYIPFCTKMVFLKYYTLSEDQLHFWSQTDRRAYIKGMNEVLEPYLSEKITVVEGV